MQSTTIHDCRIVDLRKISDPRGNLTPIEGGTDVPFEIKRVYYLYDVPGGESRGAHAHKKLSQLIIAASGSFTVTLDDGKEKKSFNRRYFFSAVRRGTVGRVLTCRWSQEPAVRQAGRCNSLRRCT